MATSKQLDISLVEKKFLTAKATPDSIQSVALWVLTHKSQCDQIVDSWLTILKTSKIDKRLTLFYICNEIVQTCRKKHAIIYKDAFKEVLSDAAILARDRSICDHVKRIFTIWQERGTYDKEFVQELLNILAGAKVQSSNSKLLNEFNPSGLRTSLKEFVDQEMDLNNKRKTLTSVNVDLNSKQIAKLFKDRDQGNQYSNQIKESCENLTEFIERMKRMIDGRVTLIDQLECALLFYETQFGEAKIVTNAYKNFGNRIKNLQKKLEEQKKILPSPASPVPSPPMDAPSPVDSLNGEVNKDNMETVDMDLSDEEPGPNSSNSDSLASTQYDFMSYMSTSHNINPVQYAVQSPAVMNQIPPHRIPNPLSHTPMPGNSPHFPPFHCQPFSNRAFFNSPPSQAQRYLPPPEFSPSQTYRNNNQQASFGQDPPPSSSWKTSSNQLSSPNSSVVDNNLNYGMRDYEMNTIDNATHQNGQQIKDAGDPFSLIDKILHMKGQNSFEGNPLMDLLSKNVKCSTVPVTTATQHLNSSPKTPVLDDSRHDNENMNIISLDSVTSQLDKNILSTVSDLKPDVFEVLKSILNNTKQPPSNDRSVHAPNQALLETPKTPTLVENEPSYHEASDYNRPADGNLYYSDDQYGDGLRFTGDENNSLQEDQDFSHPGKMPLIAPKCFLENFAQVGDESPEPPPTSDMPSDPLPPRPPEGPDFGSYSNYDNFERFSNFEDRDNFERHDNYEPNNYKEYNDFYPEDDMNMPNNFSPEFREPPMHNNPRPFCHHNSFLASRPRFNYRPEFNRNFNRNFRFHPRSSGFQDFPRQRFERSRPFGRGNYLPR